MTLDRLDPVLANPKRLAALGILAVSSDVEFAFLRDALEISDSDLSKQMGALSDANYVTSRKTGRGRTRSTWYRLTRTGRAAMQRHISALNALVHDAPNAPEPAMNQS